jgi:hypothetical protein
MTPAIHDSPGGPTSNGMVRVIPPACAGGLRCRTDLEQHGVVNHSPTAAGGNALPGFIGRIAAQK